MRVSVRLSQRRFVLFQSGVIGSLLAASLLAYVHVALTGGGVLENLVILVDVGEETNLPAFWSALNLLLAAGMLFLIVASERAAGSLVRDRWLVLASGFLVMAIDEAVQLHEKVGLTVQNRIGVPIPALGDRSWVIWGALLALAVGIFMIPLLRSLHPRTRLAFVVAAVG